MMAFMYTEKHLLRSEFIPLRGLDYHVQVWPGVTGSAPPNVQAFTDTGKLLASGASAGDVINHVTVAFAEGLVGIPLQLIEGTGALIAGDYRAAESAFMDFGVGAVAMEVGGKAADLMKSLLDVKIMTFKEEEMTSGKIAESARENMLGEVKAREYVKVEPKPIEYTPEPLPPVDPTLQPPITETRPTIYTVEGYARTVTGEVAIDPLTNDPLFNQAACFVAGTLVHTNNGLVPIEKLHAGDLVLSQPERGGEIDYRPIVRTFVREDKEVYLVQFIAEGDSEIVSLVVTSTHPFWVKELGWIGVEYLEPGHTLKLHDGSPAVVHSVSKVLSTQIQDIGWVGDQSGDTGVAVDLRDGSVNVSDKEMLNLVDLNIGKPLKTLVFNFEVEEFHTYYTGVLGVWVHNADYADPIPPDLSKLQSTCFGGDTLVLLENGKFCEIELLKVGDKVMSRCEVTGEIAPKRIVKFHEHSAKTMTLGFNFSDAYFERYGSSANLALQVTGEHPFWVEGKGWTAARDLKAGDELLTYSGEQVSVNRQPQEGSWPFSVFNLEVEDFHTYFVHLAGIWVHNKDVTVLDTSVAEPKPEWSPLHRSAEQLSTNSEGLSPSKVQVILQEMEADKFLNQAGIQTIALGDENDISGGRITNDLGIRTLDENGNQVLDEKDKPAQPSAENSPRYW